MISLLIIIIHILVSIPCQCQHKIFTAKIHLCLRVISANTMRNFTILCYSNDKNCKMNSGNPSMAHFYIKFSQLKFALKCPRLISAIKIRNSTILHQSIDENCKINLGKPSKTHLKATKLFIILKSLRGTGINFNFPSQCPPLNHTVRSRE